MLKSRTWEEECLPRLIIRNHDGPVALCLLWNPTEKAAEFAPKAMQAREISVIGNLLTPRGLGWFIRGLWKLPHIQRVLLWGSDLYNSGEGILQLWKEGPTSEHLVPQFGWKLHQLIPPDAADAIHDLRRLVEIVDLRGKNASAILGSLDVHNAATTRREIRDFPPVPAPEGLALPSRPASIFIRAKDPGEAWLHILHFLMQYGKPRDTRKKERIAAHHFSIKAVFPVPEKDDPQRWFGLSQNDADHYTSMVLSASPPTERDESGTTFLSADYHYGQRIQDWLGHNQLEEVIARLKENPETKRASISILQAPDLETLEDAPCWSLITFAVIDGALHSSNIFRSHDMFDGWPNNVLAILHIHRKIAREVGLALGSIEIISANAQIYASKSAEAEGWVHSRFTFQCAGHLIGFQPDPVGAFVFEVLPNHHVRAQLVSATGDEVLWDKESPNPSYLIRWIVESMVLKPQHIRYLGAEEEKLKRSLKTGEPYHQG